MDDKNCLETLIDKTRISIVNQPFFCRKKRKKKKRKYVCACLLTFEFMFFRKGFISFVMVDYASVFLRLFFTDVPLPKDNRPSLGLFLSLNSIISLHFINVMN